MCATNLRRKVGTTVEEQRTDGSATLPLDLLIQESENIYEITRAMIRRAYQISVTGDEELELNEGKVVSIAIKQILTKKVQYQLSE